MRVNFSSKSPSVPPFPTRRYRSLTIQLVFTRCGALPTGFGRASTTTPAVVVPLAVMHGMIKKFNPISELLQR